MKRLIPVFILLGVASTALLFHKTRRQPPAMPKAPRQNPGDNLILSPGAPPPDAPYLVVLGISQDAGYPQAGCQKACCAPAWKDQRKRRHPVCVAVVDPGTEKRWLFDCTPAFPDQLRALDQIAPPQQGHGISGILLTHAHIGHYTGLIHLGREAMGVRGVPVHAMPRMTTILKQHAPWNLLVEQRHLDLQPLAGGQAFPLQEGIVVTPLTVPHRSELSETVGFRIQGPQRSVLYLPDIDKWERWDTKIEDVIQTVDVAYVDGTFYANGEIPGRDMSEIPHPFIEESIHRFAPLSARDRNKIRFLHLNHTNPALDPNSPAARRIRQAGHHVAEQGESVPL
jgi:pyrroloquinoline quinone biosynthesis protein B